jgi:hypothetical protein
MGNEIENPREPADFICIDCGYNLHGLDPHGACPECGTPIVRSMQSHRLAGANVPWLARLCRGQAVLAFGLHLLVWTAAIVAIFVILLPVVLIAIAINQFPMMILMVAMTVGMGLICVALLICAIAAVMITAPDPRESLRETLTSPRLLSRWGMLTAVIVGVLGSVLSVLLPLMHPLITGVSVLLFGTALTVGISATLIHLSRLAQQIPDAKLIIDTKVITRRMRILVPAFFVTMSIQPLYQAMMGNSMSGAGGPLGIFMWTSCVQFILILSLIVTAGRMAMVMSRYRNAFRSCLAEAKQFAITADSTQASDNPSG